MAFNARAHGPLFILAWTATPTVDDVRDIVLKLGRARIEAGRPLRYIGIIPADRVGVPGSDARAAFTSSMREVEQSCESMDLVLIGTGVGATLIRTVLRGLAVATRSSERLRVHDGVHACARAMGLSDAEEAVVTSTAA